jgi:alcohol dehydrogenase (cytochrome c)
VNAGRWAYEQRCAVCHGQNLEGGGAPALRGTQFNAQWNGKTLQQFYSYVHSQMPLGAAGSLKGQDYVNVVAYILSRSGIPAGTQKLTMRSPMGRVMVLSDAQTATAPSSAAPATPIVMGALVGTVKAPTTSTPTQAELDAADAATGNWLMYNKGYRGERYSTLSRIERAERGRHARGLHVPAGRARHVLDRPGRVRRHPVRDDAPRHVRDRRDDVREALGRTSTSRSAPR